MISSTMPYTFNAVGAIPYLAQVLAPGPRNIGQTCAFVKLRH